MFSSIRKILLMVVFVIAACIPSGIASASLNNANTDWFMNAKYGVINHFIYGYNDITGDWNTIVNNFDVNAYADQAERAGVGYVVFTLGQNSGYYCSPNAAYNNYTGYAPGQRTSIRDLPMDLYDALNPKGIKLMLYIPANPPNRDQQARNAFNWPGADGSEYAPSQITMQKWQDGVIKEWADRYGSKVAGWWVDGMWYQSSYDDMTKAQNWSTLTNDLKSGNPNSIIALNPGMFFTVPKNSDYEDFTAGEVNHVGDLPPSGRWITGLQWHELTYLGTEWGAGGTSNTTIDVVNWVKNVTNAQGVVTFDIRTPKNGVWDTDQMNQLLAIKDAVRNNLQYNTIFYKDGNYGGSAVSLPPGNYTMSQLAAAGIQNDDISSLKVYNGIQVIGYENDNFSGASVTLTANTPNLGTLNFNDKISSVKIVGFDSGKYYKIKNHTSGKVLDSTGSTSNGTAIKQWSDVSSPNLEWQLISVGNGYYKIKNHTTGKVLDNAGSTTDGSTIYQWADVSSANLEWQMIDLGNGYYKIKNHTSGKVLDNAGSTTDGSTIYQWADVSSPNLEWSITAVN